MKKRLQNVIPLVVIIIVISFMVGCGNSNNPPADTAAGNKPLVINLAGSDMGYLTPYSHYPRGPGIFKMNLVFDSLLERGEKGYIPWLAEEWKIAPGEKIYTFTLRKGAKWHDGMPVTAADVKFTFEYVTKYPPVLDELHIDGKNVIEKIEIINDYKVNVIVSSPNATILGRLGNVRMLPKHIWEKIEDPRRFTSPEALIGSGPYRLKEYHKEQGAYQLERFKDYWGPKPKVDIVQFIPVSDSILAFNKGEIDLTMISPDLLDRYENNKEFMIKKNPAFWGYRLVFNMEKCPEFKDKNIRQAFAFAINKDELVEKVARGAAVPGSAGYLSVDHIWYNPNVMRYNFDINKAKELLQGKKLAFTLLISNVTEEVRIAELMKISLGEVGIDLTVKSCDGKTRDATARKGDYEILLTGHGGWGGDADILRVAYAFERTSNQSPSANNIYGYSNEEVNLLCQQQLAEMDWEKRKNLIFQLQELIAKEIPQIPLYNTTGYIVYRPGKYDGWRYMFDHHEVTHNKLSYLERDY